MNHPRRALGGLIYVFMALPIMLAGMATLSVRSWATDPGTYKDLVTDPRFAAVLESPDLATAAPASFSLDGGLTLEGPAAAKAFQALDPVGPVVETVTGAVDSFFAALRTGSELPPVDLTPVKRALAAGADAAAKAYLDEAKEPLAILPAGTLPEGVALSDEQVRNSGAARAALSSAIAEAGADLPDSYLLTDGGKPIDTRAESLPVIGTMRRTDLPAALGSTSLWLSLAGAGLLFASAFVSETELRRRLGSMGKRILVPGSVFLGVGLLPHLINPAAFAAGEAASAMARFPALAEYAKFVATRLTGGALVVGLVSVAIGTALVSAKRAIPPREDYEDGADL